ncbi:MAG: hypothetical protein QOG03_2052 [Actinomycetota bacterium]|nr:hypothetical protein [Actinomycetota bacterium]
MLVDGDRRVLGQLPEFEVDGPPRRVSGSWWPDAEPVVSGAAEHFGAEVDVLRLVDAFGGDYPRPRDGFVIYEAQLLNDVPSALEATGIDIGGDDPLRAAWARPGGVRAMVEWADQFVARTGPAAQVKTWNLSCIVRIPTSDGVVWAKAAPPFFSHEGAVMQAVAERHAELLPPVLAAEPGRVLLGDVAGEDQWTAGPDVLERMVRGLREMQADAPGPDDLVALGLPDWRAPALLDAFTALSQRDDVRSTIDADGRRALDAVITDLPRRLDALDGCGIAPTLVHGDFHRGNWRGDGHRLVLLDWGDSGVGHPLLDLAAFLNAMPAEWAPEMRARWLAATSGDAERAAELIQPVACLRQALIYRTFLDSIEASEQRYHEFDVPYWLRDALRTAGL